MDFRRAWRWGLGAGLAAALADAALIVAVDPGASAWTVLQSMLFWTTAGGFVVASETGLGRYAHAIATTVMLNLPWYVALSLAIAHPEHLPPLLAMSLVFGGWFGWVRGRAAASAVTAA